MLLSVRLARPVLDGDALLAKLDRARSISQKFGYGIGDNIHSLFAEYAKRRH
jgi:hypothetical protein